MCYDDKKYSLNVYTGFWDPTVMATEALCQVPERSNNNHWYQIVLKKARTLICPTMCLIGSDTCNASQQGRKTQRLIALVGAFTLIEIPTTAMM